MMSAEENDGESRKILPLVDLRPYDDFDRRHLSLAQGDNDKHGEDDDAAVVPDITVVNLPLSTLLSGERSCELPPRHVEFAILVPRQFVQTFRDNDEEGSLCSIHDLFFASRSKSTLQSRKPWLVRQVMFDGDSLWSEASEIGCVRCFDREGESGVRDRCGVFPYRSLPRLWKPDPLVCSDILPALKDWILDKRHPRSAERIDEKSTNDNCVECVDTNGTVPEKSVGLVLDLGSGAGRDICFLAEELKQFRHRLLRQATQENHSLRSIRFVGIDNHKGSAKRCLPLWKNRGVEDIAYPFLLDLKKLHLVRDHFMDASKLLQSKPLKNQRSDILCIFAIRYLNRKLLSYIANSEHTIDEVPTIIQTQSTAKHSKGVMQPLPPPLFLPPGTIVAISHFCKSEEGASWNFDHPKESNVLDRWELKKLFDGGACSNAKGHERCWQVLKDDLVFDGDHGRSLIQFVARKVS